MKKNRLTQLLAAVVLFGSASCSSERTVFVPHYTEKEVPFNAVVFTDRKNYVYPEKLRISDTTIAGGAWNQDATWVQTGTKRGRTTAVYLAQINTLGEVPDEYHRLIKDGPNAINTYDGMFLIEWKDSTQAWNIRHLIGDVRCTGDSTRTTKIFIVCRNRGVRNKDVRKYHTTRPSTPLIKESTPTQSPLSAMR